MLKSQMIFLLTIEDDECVEKEHFVIPILLKCYYKPSSSLVSLKSKPESDAAPTMIKIKKPRIQEEEEKNNVSSNISNISSQDSWVLLT